MKWVVHLKLKSDYYPPSKEIQNGDLIDEIKMQLEGKRQNGRHAKNIKNTLCTFIPAPVPVPECTSTWVQVYTYVHQCLTKETLASNINGKNH